MADKGHDRRTGTAAATVAMAISNPIVRAVKLESHSLAMALAVIVAWQKHAQIVTSGGHFPI